MSSANEGFIRYKSRHAATWALANLLRLEAVDAPCATALGRPLQGRNVIVCGAGRSLDPASLTGHAGPILAVNKSAVVLRKHGIEPYVVVARESIDVSSQVGEGTALVCADISAHPRTWAAAGGRLAWFVPAFDRHFTLAQILGVMPTFGGTSAFCTAVHLARVWGAARITIVGADLCLTDRGDGLLESYHPDAPRSSLVTRHVDGMLHLSGGEDDDALCVASGQEPPPKVIHCHALPAWDFSGVRLTHDAILDEHSWLATEAERHGDRVEFVNASRGAGIPGWRTGHASPSPHAPAPDLSHRVAPARLASMRAWLAEQAELLEQSCAELARPEGPDLVRLRSLDLTRGAPLVELLAAARQLGAPHDPNARCVHHNEAFVAAALEARAMMESVL